MNYLLTSSIAMMFFYAFFYSYLRKNSPYQFQRYYLIFTVILSLLLPLNQYEISTNLRAKLTLKISSFRIVSVPEEKDPIVFISRSENFTDAMKENFQKAEVNTRYFFEDILAMGPDGQERKLNSMIFTIVHEDIKWE